MANSISASAVSHMYPFVSGEFTPAEYHANVSGSDTATDTMKQE